MAIESLGPMEGKTLAFLKELSQRVQQRTGEGGLMPTFCNTSLSPSREEVHYLWLAHQYSSQFPRVSNPCAPIIPKWYPRLKHALCSNLRNVCALQVSKAFPSLAKRRSISKCYTLSVQDISCFARKARVSKAFPKPALQKNHNTIILLHFSTNT